MTQVRFKKALIHTCAMPALLVIALACIPTAYAFAYETKRWKVEGLPADADGSENVELPANADAATRIVKYKLENHGYPLANVHASGDRLIITYDVISEIDVSAIDENVRDLVHGYLRQLVGTSPRTEQLDRIITLINDIPGFSGSITFRRLENTGAYAVVAGGALIRQSGVASLGNSPAAEFKTRQLALHQELYSLLNDGDVLRLDLTGIDAAGDSTAAAVQGSYSVPVNHNGTFAEFRASHFDTSSGSQLEPGQSVDSKATSGAIVIGHALTRSVSLADYVFLETGYRAERATGYDDAEYAVLRTSFVETKHSEKGGNFTWGIGLSAGKETTGDGLGYGALKGGVGFMLWVPHVSDTAELRIENSWQLGSRNTPGYELHSFSGVSRQRGFEPFEYSGNYGADLTVQLADTFSPWKDDGPIVSPAVFVDMAYLGNSRSNVASDRPRNNTLMSTGLGSRVTFSNGFSFSGWLASPLYDKERTNRDRKPVFYLQGQYSW